jgi:hypothetical protein
MKRPLKQIIALAFVSVGFAAAPVRASNLDTVGVTLLRAMTTNLDGSGIRVAQPEAGYDLGTNWEVNPGVVGRPLGFLTYISANGSTTNYPNSLSSESSHADSVAGIFYGLGGVAANAAHADNYDADYFVQGDMVAGNYIITLPATNINDPVVNQSFTFGSVSTNEQEAIDSAYDNYAAQYSTLFVSAANNSGPVSPPGTAYNCISVGASDGSSSVGPTIDNGRCKPDIVAPGGETSFSTPLVAGAAAVLMQAGLRGDGGSDTNSAADIRTVKCLLLNGAVKPADWTNSNSSPLDFRYGAGVLDIFNSYEDLAGGMQGDTVSTSITSGGAHPPTGATGTVGALNGWDFNSISSSSGGILSAATDGVNHYFFNVTNNTGSAAFTLTSTLVWNRQQNQTAINNLGLFLYNCANSNLVLCSTSLVDNVQHLWLPQLPQGRYDLQVLKSAGNSVSDAETYALAFEFFSEPLAVAPSGTNVALTWPVYPDGFSAESTTSLSTPINWNTNPPSPVLTNGQNYVLLNMTNGVQFFRLHRP